MKKMSKAEAVKTLESAGLKGLDWSKINWVQILALARLLIEFFNNPQPTMKTALAHDETTCCLHHAVQLNLEAVEVMLCHLEHCCPDDAPTTPA